MIPNQNPKKNNLKKWLVLMNIPFQMGIIIFLFSSFGNWLDQKKQNEIPIYTIVLSLLAVFVSLYFVIKQVNHLNKNN